MLLSSIWKTLFSDSLNFLANVVICVGYQMAYNGLATCRADEWRHGQVAGVPHSFDLAPSN